MSNDTVSMFETLKGVLNDERKSSKPRFTDRLVMEIDNSYLMRFIMNKKDVGKTFFKYNFHGWRSKATGQYITAICPSTYGGARCPLCEARVKLYNSGDEKKKDLSGLIKKKTYHLANVYVIENPSKREDEGTVKILRMSPKMFGIVDDGVNDDDIGERIFDFTGNGCNFKVKVTSQSIGESTIIPNYDMSSFRPSSKIDGMTEESITDLQTALHDLEGTISPSTSKELVELLNVHLLGLGDFEDEDVGGDATSNLPDSLPSGSVADQKVDDDDLSELDDTLGDITNQKTPTPETKTESIIDSTRMDELMDGLSDLDD